MSDVKSSLIWILVAVVALIVILQALTMSPWMSGMMGMMGLGWIFMFIIPLAFLALIIQGVYFLVVGSKEARVQVSPTEKALEILKERYAKGEITREEYLKMKKDLES